MPGPCFSQKRALLALAALLLNLSAARLFGAQMSEGAASALSSVLEKPQGAEMNAALSCALSGLSLPQEKRELLSAFAGYEESAGLFESAASHYLQAAELAGEGSAEYFSLCLDAARIFMYANETEKANALIEKALLGCFEPELLFRARFYSACAKLSGENAPAALEQLRLYLSIEGFAPYFPQMLFILWYAAGDSDAGARLLASYPSSAEAAIVRGDASVLPRAFWYFMPTGRRPKNDGAEQGEKAASALGHPAAARWQQTGFFRSRANAQVQANELSKIGFRVFIREERRPSGETFFSVLIPEDEAGNTAIRLKENGFESYLVIE